MEININKNEKYINLYGEINNISVSNTIQKIIDVTSKYDEKSNQKDFIPEPIILIINSFGGSVYDAFALIDFIETCKYPIYTLCTGYAMSAGFMIFISGKKRFATKNSTMLYHQLSAFNWSKLQQIKEDVEEYNEMENQLISIVLDKTNITEKTIKSIHEKKQDWYIKSKDFIKLGICDKVISNMSELEED